MGFAELLAALVPTTPNDELSWEEIDALLSPVGFADLRDVPQNETYHGEGDVHAHTQLVCQELVASEGYSNLAREQRELLLLSVLLHDVGKARTTRLEDGRWRSPRHARVGAHLAREYLWKAGLAGNGAAQGFREAVCALVRHHMLPEYVLERDDAVRTTRRVAATGELAPGFDWHMLCLLAEADARGRIASDVGELLDRVELCKLLVEEAGCLLGPYPFASACTRRAYLSGRAVQPDQALYDDSWGEVVLLVGLPGTGKDTWAKVHASGLPVVSLDDVRAELGMGHREPQGRVVQAGLEMARSHLRKHQPFVWNATNITRNDRGRLVRLAERYGARVRMVYLETSWNELLVRNAGRPEHERVPTRVVERMLMRLEPPMPDEAHAVEWHCV